MHPRRVDADGVQQALEREFNDFLGFADDIGPALGLVENVKCAKAGLGPTKVIGGKGQISHQAASAQ